MRHLLSAILLLLTLAPLSAQTDYTTATPWYRQQAEVYQRWLDAEGLGRYLAVETIEVEPTSVQLYLNLKTEDAAEALARWQALEKARAALGPETLASRLFWRAAGLLQLPEEDVSVEIYDTYDITQASTFNRVIYYENGLQVDATDPKSVTRKIELDPEKLNRASAMTVAEFREAYSADRVMACVRRYAEQRYAETNCDGRQPQLRVLGEGDDARVLRFRVSDLCREVITDAENPLLCRWLRRLRHDCQWTKRERLQYTVTYEGTATGFRLTLEIDGWVGSGIWTPDEQRGYTSIEEDFNDYFIEYADALKRDFVENYLPSCHE